MWNFIETATVVMSIGLVIMSAADGNAMAALGWTAAAILGLRVLLSGNYR